MRHAPFFGWIQDLAAPDPTNIFTLFGLIPWDPTALPFIGGFLHLGVWPVIMGITMWVQMRLNPPPPDPTQAMIFNWMPVIFTFMLGTFPAGLVIYWAWNNTLSVRQQWFIMKRHGAEVNLFGNIVDELQAQAQGQSRRNRRGGDRSPPNEIEAGRLLFARPFAVHQGLRADRRPAAGRPAGDRLRRPLQCRQVVADQCADRHHGAGAHLEHAGPDAGTQHLRERPTRRCASSTCRAMALPRRPKPKVAAWTRLIHAYLTGRPNLRRVYVLVDGRHGPKANDLTRDERARQARR